MKIWTPAEEEYLAKLLARNWEPVDIARRLGCSIDDVVQHELERLKPSAAPDAVTDELPKGVTMAKVTSALPPIAREFIEASAYYKALGAKLQTMSDTIGAALADVELADAIKEALDAPRQPNETVQEKIARKLTERFMVIPRALIQ